MTDFAVYLLKSSSGRDKLLGIAENLALASSTRYVPNSERWTKLKLVESEVSQCRKGFRLAKGYPDFVRCGEALYRLITDTSIRTSKQCQLLLEAAGNFCSSLYFLYDNVGWAIGVGLVRGSTIPSALRTFAVAKRGSEVRFTHTLCECQCAG